MVISGLFTKSNLTEVEYTTKHAHLTDIKHINIIRKLLLWYYFGITLIKKKANKIRRCWYQVSPATLTRSTLLLSFVDRYERRDPDLYQGNAYDSKIPRTGMLHCKICGFYWGIIVRSVDDGVEFPVIPIKSFIIECSSGETSIIEKWGKAFEVPPISDDDRQRHTDPLIGPSGRLEGDLEEEEAETETSQPSNDLSSLPGPTSGRLEREGEEGRQETDQAAA